MNRAFPPETIEPCDHCGRDIVCVIAPEGHLEANDHRDYVDTQGIPEDEWVVVCAGCRTAVGIGDPNG
jgi:hypothetical protein